MSVSDIGFIIEQERSQGVRNRCTYFLIYNCSIPVTSASNCILFSLDSTEDSDRHLFAEG